MTFDLGIWPLTAWTYEGSHTISINQVWFQSDIQLFKRSFFTFSTYLTTWPQMTFDLDMWPLTYQQMRVPMLHLCFDPCVFPAKAGDTKIVLLQLQTWTKSWIVRFYLYFPNQQKIQFCQNVSHNLVVFTWRVISVKGEQHPWLKISMFCALSQHYQHLFEK